MAKPYNHEHIKQRAKERYNLDLTDQDIFDLNKEIVSLWIQRKATRLSVFHKCKYMWNILYTYKDTPIVVLYNVKKQKIETLQPYTPTYIGK